MILIDDKFPLASVVYVKTDIEQYPGMITGINIRPGHITYDVTCGGNTACFFDFELTLHKNSELHL